MADGTSPTEEDEWGSVVEASAVPLVAEQLLLASTLTGREQLTLETMNILKTLGALVSKSGE